MAASASASDGSSSAPVSDATSFWKARSFGAKTVSSVSPDRSSARPVASTAATSRS